MFNRLLVEAFASDSGQSVRMQASRSAIVIKGNVIKLLVSLVLFGATAGTAGADVTGAAGVTPRVTVKLGDLRGNTVIAMNEQSKDQGNVALNSNETGNTSRNAPVAANTNTNQNAAADSNENTNANASGASASASAAANVASDSSGGGSSSVGVDGDEAAASGAAPIFLSTGDDTCMGSSGLGIQGLDFGASLGTSWTDTNCVMLKNARELKNQGYDKAAKARLCMNDENALAFELAGEPCPRALQSAQAAIAKIRQWNPEYQAAAEPGPQFATTGDVASLASAGTADQDGEWMSPKIDGFIAMVRSVVDHLTAGASGGAGNAYAMDGIE